jgi:hypothetical protein
MPLLRAAPAGVFALALATVPLCAHDEWNNLHIVYSAKAEFVYPFDGRTPKVAAALLNHYPVPSVEVVQTLSVNGQVQDTGGFTTFPNGGSISVAPDDYVLASVWTAGVYDVRAGAAPAVGETKEFKFRWVFALAPGVAAPPPLGGPVIPNPLDPNTDPPGEVNATVKFKNLGDNPALSGPMAAEGIVRLGNATGGAGGAPAANVVVEVATPYSNWFRLSTTPVAESAAAVTFAQGLPERADWSVRVSAEGYETRVLALGSPFDPRTALDLTLVAAPPPPLEYKRIAAIATSTGFWRGVVSESEGTFVAFPGQETWKKGATDADSRALRTAGRVVKYKLDGTKLWEHAPGWEIWGGDMTPDGRYVAYVLNPTVSAFYTPTVNTLVLLDGTTGAVLWTKTGPRTDAVVGRKLESLEVALSPDAKWIAVGSVSGGQVTLVDRATGTFGWSAPVGAPSFGQVRRLKFSADSQALFCGSGDSYLRKLRVSDGAVLWRTLAGGWPGVNGLDVSADGAWVATGTRSLDTGIVNVSNGRQLWFAESQVEDAIFSPDARHLATASGQIYRSADGSLAGMAKTAGVSRFTPDGKYLLKVDRRLTLHDLGGKLLKDWGETGVGAAAGEQPQWAQLTKDGRYVVMLARDMANPPQTGIVIFERQTATAAVGPVTAAQPLTQAVVSGTGTTLLVAATGSAPLAYQWRKNGSDLMGAISPALTLGGLTAADAGSYTCVVSNVAGAVTSAAANLTVIAASATNPPRLSNLAVRTTVRPGTPLIVGFVVGGNGSAGNKPLLLRGMGPSLSAFGFDGALADPRLTLFGEGGQLATNDDWSGNAAVAGLATQVGAFAFAGTTSRDAALAALPGAGGYTMQVTSGDGTSGGALAEIYDASTAFSATEPRLINVSARGEVGGQNGALIAGFVIGGPAAKTVLVRGVGPALGQFGVRGVLVDPVLTVYRDSAVVATNDNWYDAPNATAVPDVTTRVGAFRLGTAARDAVLLLTLPPGAYTAQVSGTGDGQGSALVEVYEVP